MNILNFLFGKPVNLNRPVRDLDMNMIRHIVKCTAKWCAVNLGVNTERDQDMSIEIDYTDSNDFGRFIESQNRLMIYYNTNPLVRDLVKTTIHEYVHYLQPIKGNYNKLLSEYGYHNHPMEIEARKTEEDYYYSAWLYVKSKII